MTRARSILAIYAYARKNPDQQTATLLSTLGQCLDNLLEQPKVEREVSNIDEFEEVLQRIGPEKREWLVKLWKTYLIQQEPIMAPDGEILAEPLFWFQLDDRLVACFGDANPGTQALHKQEDAGIEIVRPGDEVVAGKS